MQQSKLVGYSIAVSDVVLGKELCQRCLTLLLQFTVIPAQYRLNLCLSLSRMGKVYPRRLHMLRLRGKNLHLVTALQLMTQRYKLMVYLCSDAMAAEEGVDRESKVESGTSSRHCLDFALWGKHEYLRSKEIELDSIKKVHSIRLRVVKNLLDGAQPFVQFRLVLRKLFLHAVFVFPMESYVALSILIGILMLAVGAAQLIVALTSGNYLAMRGYMVVGGIIDVLLGLFLCVYPGVTFALLPVMLGIWMMYHSFMMISFGGDLETFNIGGSTSVVVGGILLLLLSIMVLANPFSAGVATVVVMAGLGLIVLGLLLCWLALKLKNIHLNFEKEYPR